LASLIDAHLFVTADHRLDGYAPVSKAESPFFACLDAPGISDEMEREN
jgi:hypothetical protein